MRALGPAASSGSRNAHNRALCGNCEKPKLSDLRVEIASTVTPIAVAPRGRGRALLRTILRVIFAVCENFGVEVIVSFDKLGAPSVSILEQLKCIWIVARAAQR